MAPVKCAEGTEAAGFLFGKSEQPQRPNCEGRSWGDLAKDPRELQGRIHGKDTATKTILQGGQEESPREDPEGKTVSSYQSQALYTSGLTKVTPEAVTEGEHSGWSDGPREQEQLLRVTEQGNGTATGGRP